MEAGTASPFVELASVEAWDAWFRWRDQGVLKDMCIEDTWRRVCAALLSAEAPGGNALLAARLLGNLTTWRLLPDERLLADAGTERITWREDTLVAVVNVAAFVLPAGAEHAGIALSSLADCAALAVRMLDNAALLAGVSAPRLRIGLMGIADALALLGMQYDGAVGRTQVNAIARAFSEGCLRGNIELAAERGASSADTCPSLTRAERRTAPPELLRDARHHGLRYTELTALSSQPRLALFANDVADASDPLLGEDHVHVIAASGGQRSVHSSGYALDVLQARTNRHGPQPGTLSSLPWTAQLATRAVLQPWMDEPIAYPLLAASEPGDIERCAAERAAARYGLGKPTWRTLEARLQT